MVFTTTKYEADNAQIHAIRMDSVRAALAGTPPAGGVNSDVKVKISKNNKEFGIRPRGVRLFRLVGTAPDQFKKYTFLPVLTAAGLAGAGFAPGSTITIGTVAWTVASRVPEDY